MASSGSGWKVFTRISSQHWISSRLHSWSYTFPTIRIIDLSGDFIRNSALYADDTTLCSKCDQASDLMLTSKLESDLRNTRLGQEVTC